MVGFKYDPSRDAYVLRGVGKRYGPVLRSGPPVDTAAATIEWSEEMEQLAARRKSRRFARGVQEHDAARHDVLRR